jgi:HTH-type transcriptional regulator/antitoxin HigA
MADRPFDSARYGELLASTQPGIIETPEEHERLLAVAETLMERGDAISVEEEKLLALLVLLIEAFEAGAEQADDEDDEGESHNVRPPLPHETLDRLMQARRLELGDIADLFGNPHIAREVLQGKRAISRNEAKLLGRFFQVPPKLFHS